MVFILFILFLESKIMVWLYVILALAILSFSTVFINLWITKNNKNLNNKKKNSKKKTNSNKKKTTSKNKKQKNNKAKTKSTKKTQVKIKDNQKKPKTKSSSKTKVKKISNEELEKQKKQLKSLQRKFKKLQSTKTRKAKPSIIENPKKPFNKWSWRDKKWVEEHMIRSNKSKTGIISHEEYEKYSEVPGIYYFIIQDKDYLKIYIGKSKSLVLRLSYYINNMQTNNAHHIVQEMIEHGIKNTTWGVLTDEKWVEQYWKYNDEQQALFLSQREESYIELAVDVWGMEDVNNKDFTGTKYN